MGLFQPRFNEEFEINVAESLIKNSLSNTFNVPLKDIK
jgi:hypothetical protein